MLQHLRQQARRELLAESRKHPITAKLRKIPSLGPIRSALAVALIQTPHRFRTKRQLWAYSGLALETRTSGEHRYVRGQLRRSKKQVSIRGLNKDHNHDLKGLCPLGQPEKALGQEPQIDPWLTPYNHQACQFQRPIGVAATRR